jgi:hypothetical protein
MKTVTVEQALTFSWCYTKKKIRAIAGSKTEWTALDVLRLTNVPAKDRQYAVFRPEFLEDEIMYEIACQYTEDAFTHIKAPDPRSVTGIETKRRWMRGEATDEELYAAWFAANAAANAAARDATDAADTAAYSAAWAAADVAAMTAANAAADAAACAAADAAYSAAWYAAYAAAYSAAWDAAYADAWNEAKGAAHGRQVEMLIKLLEEAA